MADPRKKNPLVLPNYPYLGKFTPAQTEEALARKDKLVEIMLDPVGPDGTIINIPMDMLHILGFHMALAGADVHTDHRQLIESRTRRDDTGMFEMCEWRARGEFGDTETTTTDAGGEAAAVAAQMRSQLTPEVRAALAAILAEEYAAATTGTEPTRREKADNVLTEARELPKGD